MYNLPIKLFFYKSFGFSEFEGKNWIHDRALHSGELFAIYKYLHSLCAECVASV